MPERPADATPRALLVEDSEDTRILLAVALTNDGWRVDQAGDAFHGLDLLRGARYDALIADYDLPGKTGAVMIKEAAAEGLLDGTRVVVVTAHPDPRGLDDLPVMRKPLDLAAFLAQMSRIRETAVAARRAQAPAAPLLDLVLYVSAQSLSSARAIEVLRELVPDTLAGVRLTICDLSLQPSAGDADNVVFTPTLVKREPAPRTWILGDLTRPDTVGELIRSFRSPS